MNAYHAAPAPPAASRSARASRGLPRLAMTCLGLALASLAPASARAAVSDVRGTIGFGYTKLFAVGAPAGSMSTTAGLSYPLRSNLSIGPAITFHLLGSRTVERGSLIASVDYSAFETALLANWEPKGWGPVGMVSVGPEVFSARADLSTTGGGAAFSDLAVHQTAAAAAVNVTLMRSRPSPVRVGLELGWRWAFLPGDHWRLASGRLSFHY